MKANDNSVNIENSVRSYHHGGLRAAVIAEGLSQLKNETVEALSLRQIARNVGVSATAIYRHFPDKASLLSALARAGFESLGAQQSGAAEIGGKGSFAAVGQAYVRFAIANPSLFRLMFSTSLDRTGSAEECDQTSPFQLLRSGVVALLPKESSRTDELVSMLRAWSLVHGLAMLILDQQVDQAEANELIDQIISVDSLNL